ncbi:MAG: DUF4399 domain-containing protein [Pseudorhodoplanes sp.]
MAHVFATTGRRAGFVALVAGFILLGGFGAAFAQAPTGGTTPSAPGASVYFVGLKNGDTISGLKVTIKFGLRGMGIAPAGSDQANAGHHHLLIDTDLPPLNEPVPSDFNHLHFGAGQSEAEISFSPGEHTLQLLLGDKDHVPHSPAVISERIRVRVIDPMGGAMAVSQPAGTTTKAVERNPAAKDAQVYFIYPNNGDTVARNVTIHFGLRNMGISPAGVARPYSGHHHILIDTRLASFNAPIPSDLNHLHFGAGQTEAEVTLPLGEHTLQLVLADENHVPHDPPVMSEPIKVTVTETGTKPAPIASTAPTARAEPAWIGIAIRKVLLNDAARAVAGQESGAEIVSAYDFGPAGKAGLRPSDIIVAIDGKPVIDHAAVPEAVRHKSPGTRISISIVRDGRLLELSLTTGSRIDARVAAEAGNPAAQWVLGSVYQTGAGVPVDLVESFKWFSKAAERGYADAESSLGYAYAEGLGVEKNEAAARKWYLRAAEQGIASAQYNLGNIYSTGRSVPVDQAEAFKWYLKAASQGYALAQVNVGFSYAYGRGVAANDREALVWFQRAVEQKNPYGQFQLAVFYDEGRGGLPKDRAMAVRLMREAAIGGVNDALPRLKGWNAEPYDLAEIQQALRKLGHDPGPVNGAMRPETTAAIRKFQAAASLPADGRPSPALVKTLRERVAAAGATSE